MIKNITEKNKLIKSALMIYFITAIVVLGSFLLVLNTMSRTISNDIARTLVNQYSVEVASNFRNSINDYFILTQQLSHSATISRWLNDDENLELRDLAFIEAANFIKATPETFVMFTVYSETGNLRAYEFSADIVYEPTWEPWGYYERYHPATLWFFNTLNSPIPFLININTYTVIGGGDIGFNVFINHIMYYNDEPVGVVTLRFPFGPILESVLAQFDSENIRIYLIDRFGNVRIDSHWQLETLNDGIPANVTIPEVEKFSDLREALEKYLAQLGDNWFTYGKRGNDFVELNDGYYTHASIEPIIGTDWSVVILYNHQSIFGFGFYTPIILVGSLAIFVIILLGGFLITEISRITVKEMRHAEIAEQSAMSQSRFLARMSHEIRTPISAVLGISEMNLKNSEIDDNIKKSFSKIYNSGNILLSLIDNILDISAIESGKLNIVQEEYDIEKSFGQLIYMQTDRTHQKDINFIVKVGDNIPEKVIGVPLRLFQIINNLLNNSFKYNKSGGSVTLDISCQVHEKTARFTVVVSDTGIGMNQEQLSNLGGEYTRFHDKEYTDIQGTGLGLAIVFNLATKINANIDIQSEPNKGTTATLTFDQQIVSTATLTKEAIERLTNFEYVETYDNKNFVPEKMSYGKILVVDDVASNLYVASGLLSFYDLQVETVTNGVDAIEKVTAGNEYDIIFMDYMMPGLNGTEVLKILRNKGYKKTIIALTANAMIGKKEEFVKAGFDDFISKPIDSSRLDMILVKYIKDTQTQEDREDFQNSVQLRNRLYKDFLENYVNYYEDIEKAVHAKDFEQAHFLIHKLKGISGLIKEKDLTHICQQLENLFEEKTASQEQMAILQSEFEKTLAKIEEKSPKETYTLKNKDKLLEILDKIEPMLKGNDTKAINFVPQLKKIPEAVVLAEQIDSLDFFNATANLEVLRDIAKNAD